MNSEFNIKAMFLFCSIPALVVLVSSLLHHLHWGW